MDQEAENISYQRLQSPETDLSNKNTSKKLPTPPLIEDLHVSAQRSNNAPYPLFTRFLPNDIGLVSTPLLISPEGVEPGYEQGYTNGFKVDGIFRYGRLKPTHGFMCTPFSIKSGEYTTDTFHRNWPILRQVLLLGLFAFLVGALCLLIGLLITSPLSPPCPQDDTRHKWFQGALFYEIFPSSFQDTDGDGYGDFQGISRRLDYIKELGAKAIRLNSVFCALDYPLEFEHIIDLRNVDPHLGRLRDFKDMVRQAHKKGIRVVLDLNPTVTSDQHTWALHWQRGIDGYQHFYASANRSKAPPEMEDSNGPPPDSWELRQRTFGGHYMVNWSSPSVHREYLKTLNFWIDLGVDGFYMKHLEHIKVMDKLDIVKVIHQWRQELDRFRLWASNTNKVLITSVKFVEFLEKTLNNPEPVLKLIDLVDVPVIFEEEDCYVEEMAKQIENVRSSSWRQTLSAPWILWHVGSADMFRFANRVKAQYREGVLYSVLMLPESTSVFYGDEIGLVDSYDYLTGNVYRGGQFSPMQWSTDNQTAGFTDNSTDPWIPVIQNHFLSPEDTRQVLDRFIRFANVRNVHSWNRNFRLVGPKDRDLFGLERPDSEEYQLLFYSSFASTDPVSRNFSKPFREVNVLASTPNFTEILWNAKQFTLNPGGAFVAEAHV